MTSAASALSAESATPSRALPSPTGGTSGDYKLVDWTMALPFCVFVSLSVCATVVFRCIKKVREQLVMRRRQLDWEFYP